MAKIGFNTLSINNFSISIALLLLTVLLESGTSLQDVLPNSYPDSSLPAHNGGLPATGTLPGTTAGINHDGLLGTGDLSKTLIDPRCSWRFTSDVGRVQPGPMKHHLDPNNDPEVKAAADFAAQELLKCQFAKLTVQKIIFCEYQNLPGLLANEPSQTITYRLVLYCSIDNGSGKTFTFEAEVQTVKIKQLGVERKILLYTKALE